MTIELSLPPDRRWQPLAAFADEARQLLDQYMHDLGSIKPYEEYLLFYRDSIQKLWQLVIAL
jgi:hypothetical protein